MHVEIEVEYNQEERDNFLLLHHYNEFKEPPKGYKWEVTGYDHNKVKAVKIETEVEVKTEKQKEV